MFNRIISVVYSNAWNPLTVCKNWIISITLQYLESFDGVQMNELYWIESLVLNSNNSNHFTV